jgi:hypothetical protein
LWGAGARRPRAYPVVDKGLLDLANAESGAGIPGEESCITGAKIDGEHTQMPTSKRARISRPEAQDDILGRQSGSSAP